MAGHAYPSLCRSSQSPEIKRQPAMNAAIAFFFLISISVKEHPVFLNIALNPLWSMTLDITLGWLGEEIEGHDLERIAAQIAKNLEPVVGDCLRFNILPEPVSLQFPEGPRMPPDALFAPTAYPVIRDYLGKEHLINQDAVLLVSADRLFNRYRVMGDDGLEEKVSEVSGTCSLNLSVLNGPRLASLPGDTEMYLANVLTHELGHAFRLEDYHLPKFGYIPFIYHDRHCFMMQSSDNVETLPQEISGRQYFCKACSRKIQRWHDTLIK